MKKSPKPPIKTFTSKKIIVAGGGVLGSQIAFQAAYVGHDVTIWLRSAESIERTKPKLADLKKTYLSTIKQMATHPDQVWALGIAGPDATPKTFKPDACIKKVESAFANIKLELDLKTAVQNADLVIESVAELKSAKLEFYKTLAPLLDYKTIVATNSSTLLPSTFAKSTGRPAKYLAMHFANAIYKNNITEIMAQKDTSRKTFDTAIKFAESFNMIPIPIKKEKSGYILNSLLVPFLLSSLDLYVNGVAEPADIDRDWRTSTGAPRGPFEILDVVGLETAYNIAEQYQKVPAVVKPLLKKMLLPYNFKGMKQLLKSYIDAGKLGKSSGEGFYKY